MGCWYSWEHSGFASLSQRFDPATVHQKFKLELSSILQYNFIMKSHKPRNHVALALMKRGGSGVHKKSHKQLRGKWKRTLGV